MPSLAVPLILVFLAYVPLQTLASCPDQWLSYSQACYRFILNSLKNIDKAKEECNKYGAALVSVNSEGENRFLTTYFGQNKLTGFTWHTSGEYIGDGKFRWMGDGREVNNQATFWANGTGNNNTGYSIVYAYVDNQYRWIRGEGRESRSSICEIPEKESFRIYSQKRSFDYGQHLQDMNNLMRGPKMKSEPMNALTIESPPMAYMEFVAFGNPSPTYQWYRGDTKITSQLNPRYTLTNGRLTISNPVKGEDDTYYQCFASNSLGKIISRRVQFTFGSLGEFLNTQREGVVAKKYEGTYLECKPPNHNPAIRYQWAFRDNVNFVRPESNAYIFISRNGNLYFSEVTENDDGNYYCTVALASQETYREFSSTQTQLRTSLAIQLTVKHNDGGNIKPQIHGDFPSVFPEQPLEGETIFIECFAFGTYSLQYRWSRTDGKMPSNVRFTDHNRVMIFPKSSIDVSGNYNCRVTNSFGSDTTDVLLDVNVRPHFKTPLKDQILDIGSQLTWRCETHAKPAAVYSWYKDGEPVKPVSGRVIVNNNVMTIFQISDRDNGMYQCKAENEFGSAFSGGQLQVLELKPEFWSDPLPTSTLASKSGNATLPCRPEAAPYPTIEWSKNGMSLGLTAGTTSNRYTLFYNGDLLITNIASSDAGVYKCEATNNLGSASTQTELIVKSNTVITTIPRSTKVIYNETAVLKCQASYNKDLDAIYSWSFNGFDIDVEKNPDYAAGDGDSKGDIYIRNAEFKHAGFYLCQVKTIIDTISRGAQLTVIGPPGPPQGVKANEVLNQKDSLTLSWFDGLDNDAPISYYIVEYKTNFTKSWELFGPEISRHMVEVNSQTNQLSTVIHGLIPAASYRFRIGAINKYGTGEKSISTSLIKMKPDKPRKAPDEVGGGGGKVSTLVITWKPLLHQDHNGKDFGYQVFYRKKRDEFKPEHVWTATNVSASTNKVTFQIDAKNYYTEYEVQIQAKNEMGVGPKSMIVTIFSAEDLPAITVTNVKGSAYNATAIQVTWNPVKDDRKSLKGKLLGYKVKYWRMNLTELRAIEAIHYGQASSAIIIGLQPNTYYKFRMMVFNSAGFGPISDEYFSKTYHKPPTEYPTEVDILPYNTKVCFVTFRGVSTKSDEEPLQGYVVKYWKANDNIRQAKVIDLGRDIRGEITGLSEAVVYNLRVLGYSRGGEGAKSSPITKFLLTQTGQVQRDMYDPKTTAVELAGTPSQMTFPLTMCCLSILLSQVYSLLVI